MNERTKFIIDHSSNNVINFGTELQKSCSSSNNVTEMDKVTQYLKQEMFKKHFKEKFDFDGLGEPNPGILLPDSVVGIDHHECTFKTNSEFMLNHFNLSENVRKNLKDKMTNLFRHV